jgi:sensor histidine kinase YesM
MALFNISLKRFRLSRVALVVFGASFCLILFVYLSKFIGDEEFNWDAYWEYFPNHLLGTIATTLFSYFTLNHFHYLFTYRKGFTHFILPLFLCIAAIESYNLLIDYYMPLQSNIDDPIPLAKQALGNFIIALMYIIFILVLSYIIYLRDVRKSKQLLEEQQLRLQVEKMNADLKFLKSQINPHFLHNTLNSFYARSLPLSKELADGILTLSEMMRYALGESYTEDGKVLLKDEIEHLRNFIKMNQFRFRNHLNVELEVNGKTNGAVIIPFVLITLVENIFKHGEMTSSNHPIRICIDIKNDSLRYYSKNRKKKGPKEISTGIGLDNIRKRLDFTYGNDYELNIQDEEDCYSTELLIHKL